MSEINKSEKAKGILAKIAAMFSAAEPEYKLTDGTILKMDKMEKGGKIEGVTAANTYTLANGTKITCDVAGVITEVVPLSLKEYKLADGTSITCDKLEVGGMATMGGTPAPAGEYKLEDGSSLTVDAMGMITAVTPVAASATPDMSTPEGIATAYAKFAEGTLDLAGMSTILKALMEYSFGWQLREAQEKATRDAAMKVYTDSLKTAETTITTTKEQVVAQSAMLKQMFELMTEVLGAPVGDPPANGGKKKFSFADVEGKKKSFERFQQAAKKLGEQLEKVA